jgi:hypothetical protein
LSAGIIKFCVGRTVNGIVIVAWCDVCVVTARDDMCCCVGMSVC